MTFRSILLGVLGALALCAGVFYSDQVARNTFLTGNFLPPVVFGALLALTLIVNPLLRLLRRRALNAVEMAMIAGFWLVACFPAGRSFSHWFGNFLMLPHHWERLNPAWSGAPPTLLAEDIRDPETLRRTIAEGREGPPGEPLRAIAERLPFPQEPGESGASDRHSAAQWAALLNSLIEDPSWAASMRGQSLPRPPPPYVRYLVSRSFDRLPLEKKRTVARGLLEATLPGIEPRRPALIEAVPPFFLADPSADPRRALDGYVTGLREPGKTFGVRDVPWGAWKTALLFWMPLLYAFVICSLGLGLLLHRQWARHELLPYPTAEAIRGLLPEAGQRFGPALRDRGFWMACGAVFAVHMANYLHRWFPDYGIPINLRLDFRPLLELAPVFRRGGGESLFAPTVYFTAVGFAFYLASDVSFSLGIGPFLYVLAAGVAAVFGLVFSEGGGHLSLDMSTAIYGGAVAATFLGVVWSGRRFFADAILAGLGRRRGTHLSATDRWGARLALLGFAAFVAQLAAAGIEWPIALLYTVFLMMIFVTIARLVAEGGTIFYHPYGSPCVMVWLFMGTSALGYQQLLLISLVSSLFIIETRETLLPLALTAFKAADDQGASLGRLAAGGGAVVAAGLLAAAGASIYFQYREGAVRVGDQWTVQGIPQMSLNIVARVLSNVQARGELERAHVASGAERWRRLSPQGRYLAAFGVAFGLALALTFLRRRFAGWPLHPIFLMLGPTYEGRVFAFSFLLGWAIKGFVLTFGGARLYQRLKAPMLGLVFGEVLATVVPIVVSIIYAAVTGRPAVTMRVLPG